MALIVLELCLRQYLHSIWIFKNRSDFQLAIVGKCNFPENWRQIMHFEWMTSIGGIVSLNQQALNRYVYTIELKTGRTGLTKLILNPDLDLKSEPIIDAFFFLLLLCVLLYSLHTIFERKSEDGKPFEFCQIDWYCVWWMQLKIKQVKSILNRIAAADLTTECRPICIIGNSVICQYIHGRTYSKCESQSNSRSIYGTKATHTHTFCMDKI